MGYKGPIIYRQPSHNSSVKCRFFNKDPREKRFKQGLPKDRYPKDDKCQNYFQMPIKSLIL